MTVLKNTPFDIVNWPKPLLLVTTLGLVAAVAAMDLVTTDELSYYVFYVLPVTFAAWTIGWRSGLAAASAATIAWLLVDILSGHKYSHPLLLVANTFIRWFAYTLTSLFVSMHRQSRLELAAYAKNLETKVAFRTAKLQERVTELELFSYSISHNLRAPLRAVAGLAELSEDDLKQQKPASEIQSHLREIKAAGIRMDRLVTDLVEYVQLTITEPEPQPTYLLPIISNAIEANRSMIKLKGAVVDESAWHGVVWANSKMLGAALSQVIDNALRYSSPERRPVITIRVEDLPPNNVKIAITDNGIGIAPQHQTKIFGLFEQLHSQPQFESGSGMGLPIARKALEKFGGSIQVHSEGEGRGATFDIKLRLHQPAAASDSTVHIVSRASSSIGSAQLTSAH